MRIQKGSLTHRNWDEIESGTKKTNGPSDEAKGNGKEKGIVCKAIDDLIEQGVERGIRQGKMLDLQSIMETLHLTMEQAMNALKIPQEERETLIKMMEN